MLTKREQEVLDFIKSYQLKHKVSPIDRHVAEHFGITRQSGNWHIRKLETKGVFKRHDLTIPWLH